MKNKILKTLLIMLFLLGTFYSISSAVSITATSTTVNSGESGSITIIASEKLSAYRISVSNAGGLNFTNATSTAGSGNDTMITGASDAGVTTLGTFGFIAPTVTEDTTYTITFDCSNLVLSTDNETNVQSATATARITVQAKEEPEPPLNNNTNSNTNTNTNTSTNTNTNANTNTNRNTNKNTTTTTPTKSSNNYLESIRLSAGTLSPEFNKRVTSYTVNVEENTEKIRITAQAEDNKAEVKGDGEISLEDDETTVRIQVVAENGSTNTYTIKIQKGVSDEEQNRTIGIQAIGVDAVKENGEYIKVELTPDFDPLIYEYTCDVERDVVSLSVEAVPNTEGMTVEILGGKDLQIGENVITIIVKNPETDETLTYQILVQKSSLDEEALNALKEQQEQQAKTELIKKIIFATCVSIIAIAGIIFAVMEYRYAKTKENAFGDSETQEDNENILYEDETTEMKEDSAKGKKGGRHF